MHKEGKQRTYVEQINFHCLFFCVYVLFKRKKRNWIQWNWIEIKTCSQSTSTYISSRIIDTTSCFIQWFFFLFHIFSCTEFYIQSHFFCRLAEYATVMEIFFSSKIVNICNSNHAYPSKYIRQLYRCIVYFFFGSRKLGRVFVSVVFAYPYR